MLSSLRPLRYRNYALIWTAALLSNIGSWMQTVAVGVLVTARTGQPGWTGLVAAAAFLPIGFLSPLGGVLADRLDRRRWLFLTTVGETLFAAVLAALAATGHANPGVVTALVFGGGAMAAVGFPAYQAILPSLVPADELGSAISLSSAQFNLGRVVGPALAGLAIVAGGYSWAFAINAGSFVVVLIALCLVRLPNLRPPDGAESLRQRLLEGARATAQNPSARLAVLVISIVGLTASPFIALIPAVALKAFHSQATGTSVLVTGQGIGAVVGALALTPLANRYGRRSLLLADLVAVSVLLIAYGVSPDLWVAAVDMVLLGAAYIGVLAGCNILILFTATDAMRGRMLGIYMMALGVLYPIGALVQGAIANLVGIRTVTVCGAVILLAATGLVLRSRILALAEGPPPASVAGPSVPRPSSLDLGAVLPDALAPLPDSSL
jgi:MFS family permease